MPEQSYAQPPARNTRSGCLTVLYVVIGLVILTVIGLVIGTWAFVRSETGQKLVSTAREGIQLAQGAATAPGTQALREAGCSQAAVMPFGKLMELLGQVVTVPEDQITRTGAADRIVFCQITDTAVDAPACADVARIYGKAAPDAPERFGVLVQRAGVRKPLCEGTYAADGTFIGSFEPAPRSREPAGEPVEF